MVKRMILHKRGAIAAALLPLAALAGAGIASAQALVIKASGPSAAQYPAGRKLAAGSSVKLAGGDVLVLLDNGGTRTLSGPGSYPVTASAPTQVAANSGIAALLSARRTGLARTGAVRGVEEDPRPARSPNLWYVDFARSQTVCEPDLATVRLWRADIAKPATFRIVAANGGASAEVTMAQGQAVAAWPTTLPIADGARFVVTGDGLADETGLRFVKIDAPAARADAVATTLIGHGCSVQLDLVVSSMPSRDGSVAGN